MAAQVAKTTLVSFDNEPLVRQKIAAELARRPRVLLLRTRSREASRRRRGDAQVQPLVEAWAGMELKHTAFYGIREYHRGAELRMHVDKVKTRACLRDAFSLCETWSVLSHR